MKYRRILWCVCLFVLLLPNAGLAQGSTTCFTSGWVAPAGKGTDADGRRVITVHIDSTWGSQTPDKLWNGVNWAIAELNDIQDQNGNKSPYLILLDQGLNHGTPDFTITKDNRDYVAQIDGHGNGGPATIYFNDVMLSDWFLTHYIKVTTGHEVSHGLGLDTGAQGQSVMSYMRAWYDQSVGHWKYYTEVYGVKPADIFAIRTAFFAPYNCQGGPKGTGTQEIVFDGFDPSTSGGSEEVYDGSDGYYECWTTWAVTYYLRPDENGHWYVYDMSYDYVIRTDCYPLMEGGL